jgi:tetratricopeptide (TPR) repeat protein
MTTQRSLKLIAAGSFLAFGLALSPGFAAGNSSGGSSGGGTGDTAPSAASLGCKKKQVVKKVKKSGKMVWGCVDKTAGVLTDDQLYQQGVALAKEGHYEWALDVLASISNQNDPNVLNYIGYSHRKAGRIETGVEFYRKALAINPDFVLAREYLGEGYVAAGWIDLAQAELAEIGKRCGVTCEEYKALSDVISKAVN